MLILLTEEGITCNGHGSGYARLFQSSSGCLVKNSGTHGQLRFRVEERRRHPPNTDDWVKRAQ